MQSYVVYHVVYCVINIALSYHYGTNTYHVTKWILSKFLLCTSYNVRITMYGIQCTTCIACTFYDIQFTIYNVREHHRYNNPLSSGGIDLKSTRAIRHGMTSSDMTSHHYAIALIHPPSRWRNAAILIVGVIIIVPDRLLIINIVDHTRMGLVVRISV